MANSNLQLSVLTSLLVIIIWFPMNIKNIFGMSNGTGKMQKFGQHALVNSLVQQRLIASPRGIDAMKSVDRAAFIDDRFYNKMYAYADEPAPIGHGQTISAPHMHATVLELLDAQLKPGHRVLDVGSGSGYLVAVFAKLVLPGGSVLGLEKVPELAQRSISSIQAACPELAAEQGKGWRVEHGNALSEVTKKEDPFHAIHVGAAADELPRILVDKLANGGRMVVPVGPRYTAQRLMTIDKDMDGRVHQRDGGLLVNYVPLTRPSELEDGYAP
ncbi:protein-L-isoaspartate O-methyltransferase-like protein [Dunaliella salina]|uniref:protein-L-isoaspartate(D-aspartate) O-methyltransferase n=1 Tax=Dunaliella salina TaxID=3046 RepID=A0ABQ7G480_DUNSA|nr:protein-L-isoaspartate O-methyltransferase-like protein [Dunaliella salina]|eukprot:KAF5829421.1 protein-L-isoaspartate O-methyltransferase-like protein [Dunaliella salina]